MRPLATIAIASVLAAPAAFAQSDPIAPPATGAAEDVDPLPLDEATARAICNGPFGGAFAVLGLWAVDGTLVAIELRGDLTEYSHPPSVFYSPGGTERATVGEHPVLPGSADAEAAAATIAEATAGGTLVETRSCAPFVEAEDASTNGAE